MDKSYSGRQRIAGWAARILAGLLLLLIIAQLLIYFVIAPRLADKLKKDVRRKSNGLYTLAIGDAGFSAFGNHFYAKDIHLTPDDSLRHSSGRRPASGKYLYDISASAIEISGIHLLMYLIRGNIDVKAIVIKRPVCRITRVTSGDRPSGKRGTSGTLALLSRDKSFGVGELTVSDGSFQFFRQKKDTSATISLDNISFHLTDIRIDSSIAFPYIGEAETHLENIRWNLPNGLYRLSIGKIDLSTIKQRQEIDSIRLLPEYPQYRFAHVAGHQIDRITVTIPQIQIHHFRLLKEGEKAGAGAESIVFDRPRIVTFRDKRVPRSPEKRHPKLPRQFLHNLGIQISFDTIKVRNGYISYSEYNDGADRPGTVTFERMNAKITGVTNDPALIRRDRALRWHATARLMGHTLLTADFNMPLSNPDEPFTYHGSLDSMSIIAMNPVLKPIAFIRVESGYEEKLSFSVRGNKDSARGRMQFRYRNLEIKMADKKGENPLLSAFKKTAGSFMINNFVIRKNNPSNPGDSLRTGEIRFKRDKTRFIFNYWWKTLLSGFKSSITG